MKYLEPYKIFEKTTLISLGIHPDAMKDIQKNYEISNTAEWKKLPFKKSVYDCFKNVTGNKLVICVDEGVSVFYSLNNEYFLDKYNLNTDDDFGGGFWDREPRKQLKLYEIPNFFSKKYNYYELINGDWKYEFAKKRKIKKAETEFEQTTKEFKEDFSKNFTRIVKKIYGKRADDAQQRIISNLQDVNDDIPPDQIKSILFTNVEKAKEVDVLKHKSGSPDPYNLTSPAIKDNSLTIFDEYLISFESEYSDKYEEYLTIPSMIKKFGPEKVQTAFIVYLLNRKLLDL